MLYYIICCKGGAGPPEAPPEESASAPSRPRHAEAGAKLYYSIAYSI